MLFNSYAFLFCFLPLLLMCMAFGPVFANKNGFFNQSGILGLILLVFSAVFYGLWGFSYLCLFAAVIFVNYFFGLYLAPPNAGTASLPQKLMKRRKNILAFALFLNLLPLLWFKYSYFIISNIKELLNLSLSFQSPGLPLGISFYTFIQIAWLVAVYKGAVKPAGFSRHALFSAAFPYVISGPIVRYEQLGPELDNLKPADAEHLSRGFTLLTMGLAKKVLLADSIGVYADSIFNAAEKGFGLSAAEAWLGSLCYTFQLYFDFSGYTDMALGIGLMIGLKLPENFNSPYKSTGIVDFWRRWHITLGTWLKDFLYIPLGGNRNGRFAQYRNLFLTMLIGGAWHGAGWTFIIWGALHGFMLGVNHFFKAIVKGHPKQYILELWPVKICSVMLTFFCINFCWVIFRAATLNGATRMYKAMFFGSENALPVGDAAGTAQADGFIPQIMSLPAQILPHTYFNGWQPWALLCCCICLCWFFPNSHEILYGKSFDNKQKNIWLKWKPDAKWALALALLAFSALLLLGRQSTFLYFQF